jgi:hypothetical protein
MRFPVLSTASRSFKNILLFFNSSQAACRKRKMRSNWKIAATGNDERKKCALAFLADLVMEPF